ncbi:Cof-type HAD-IIB family hydrolase [Metabacillus arenae]|uniref:HAD family phosphatase n=1 Tax=Metabacillus arenae TaxID=2771434 RepID=A0A926NL41_9BACI|nr:Cof-type HAD-IIB family hydrolase [Metabacillus arenae]MBD1383366.1 HAD family phosphatase [Metabacillus arenae]
MIYRLLAINIDGTLLRSNGRMQPATKEAIEFVKKKDVYVTLFTNRHYQSAKKIAKALKLNTLLITHSGAFVADNVELPFYNKRIREERTFNIVHILEQFDCNVRIVHERYSIGNRKKVNTNLVGKTLVHPSDPLFYPVQFVESLSDFLRDEPVEATKIEVFFSNHEEKKKVKQTIVNAFEGIDILDPQEQRLIIVLEGVSKANSLRYLGKHLGIKTNEMVVIGDSYDDKEAIEQAGLGVAMGNAPFELKRAADWVTRTNDENGVAYMIKEHFRMQQRPGFLAVYKGNK